MQIRNKQHTIESLKLLTVVNKDGCWIWQSTKRSNGYGITTYKGVQTTTHRVAYQIANNLLLSSDMEVDHLCNNRDCINPDHLEAVSHEENMKRGRDRRTACKKGHAWTEENTYTTIVKRKQGGTRTQRYCRICRCQHQKDLRQRKETK
jgi:hypothetical protein